MVGPLSAVSVVEFVEKSVVPGHVAHADRRASHRPLANTGHHHRRAAQE